MQPKPTVALDPQERLDAVVTAYLKAVEAGPKPDRQQWLAQYPDVAKELAEFFADEDRMARVAAPLRVPVNQATPRPPANKTLNVPSAIPVGRFGDYELQAEIARGGMGVVYKARQVSVNRVVALKMILGGAVASPADVQRFHNEAEAAAHLDHPNIIPIYDVGTTDGQPFFTMKLITGGSLAERLPGADADRKPLIILLAKVARAVHYAHQRGILHRDLKPANILISGHTDSSGSVEIKSSASGDGVHGPTPVVTDFGLAKLVERGSDITRSGAIVGTPTYMAPEQAKGQHKTISTAADVYSLGVILYEVLTGRVPFKGETPMDTVLQLLEREPTPPRQLNRRIDADLETICLKCLEKEPARRYESAEALAEELERWLAGETIKARPVGRLRYVAKWARRKPQLAAIAALILILAGVAPVALIKWDQANHLFAAEAQAKNEADQARKQAQDQAQAEKTARKQAEDARADAQKQAERARQALAQVEQKTYYASIGQIEGQLRIHNVLRARELLDACPQGLRQWEWNYLQRRSHLELATWQPYGGGGFLWCDFSADGQRIAALWWNGRPADQAEVCVLNAQTGQPIWQHAAVANWGACATLGPDHLIAFPTREGNAGVVEVWDTQKNRRVTALRGHQRLVSSVGFSADGKRLVSTAQGGFTSDNRPVVTVQGELKIWDVASGQVQHSRNDLGASGVAFSSDSDLIAVATANSTIQLIDAASGETKMTLPGHPRKPLFGLAFRPGSATLVSTSEDEIKLWSTQTGKETGTLSKQNGFIFAVAFSRDGKRMATTACDMTVRVWDAETLEELYALGGHTKPVMGVCFHPNGNRLVSVSSDSTIRLWNTPASLEASVLTDAAALRNAVCSAAGTRIATSSALGGNIGEAKVWDAATSRLLQTVKHVASNAALSPDGSLLAVGMAPNVTLGLGGMKLASGEALVKIYDVASGKEMQVLKGHKATPTQVAFSRDGKRLVSSCSFGNLQTRVGQSEIKVWDVAAAKELRSWSGPQVVGNGTALSVSADGKYVAAAGIDGPQRVNVAQVWNAETGALLFTAKKHPESVEAVALSPDGCYLAEAAGTFEERPQITVYDLTTGSEVACLKGHFSTIFGLAFAPDGKRLASASYDRTVKIWDPLKGEEVLTLHGHASHVYSVAFSNDGRRLVSAGSDKTFRIWDAAPSASATAKK